jgi:hypothetical protein
MTDWSQAIAEANERIIPTGPQGAPQRAHADLAIAELPPDARKWLHHWRQQATAMEHAMTERR